MRELEVEELQNIELDILKSIHELCEENNIRYFLAYGTLLGAIRHKGFIPWDDDVDICMPREDYERFIELAKGQNKFRVLNFPGSEEYYLPFVKACAFGTIVKETIVKDTPNCGVWVDIFPIDGLAKKRICAKFNHLVMSILMRLLAIASVQNIRITSIKLFAVRLAKLVAPSQQKLVSVIDRKARKFKIENSKYVGVAFGYYGAKEIFDKSVFSDTITVEFEKNLFYAPKGYDVYLTQFYGDYMTPPPPEKQVTHHSFIAYADN